MGNTPFETRGHHLGNSHPASFQLYAFSISFQEQRFNSIFTSNKSPGEGGAAPDSAAPPFGIMI